MINLDLLVNELLELSPSPILVIESTDKEIREGYVVLPEDMGKFYELAKRLSYYSNVRDITIGFDPQQKAAMLYYSSLKEYSDIYYTNNSLLKISLDGPNLTFSLQHVSIPNALLKEGFSVKFGYYVNDIIDEFSVVKTLTAEDIKIVSKPIDIPDCEEEDDVEPARWDSEEPEPEEPDTDYMPTSTVLGYAPSDYYYYSEPNKLKEDKNWVLTNEHGDYLYRRSEPKISGPDITKAKHFKSRKKAIKFLENTVFSGNDGCIIPYYTI